MHWDFSDQIKALTIIYVSKLQNQYHFFHISEKTLLKTMLCSVTKPDSLKTRSSVPFDDVKPC